MKPEGPPAARISDQEAPEPSRQLQDQEDQDGDVDRLPEGSLRQVYPFAVSAKTALAATHLLAIFSQRCAVKSSSLLGMDSPRRPFGVPR